MKSVKLIYLTHCRRLNTDDLLDIVEVLEKIVELDTLDTAMLEAVSEVLGERVAQIKAVKRYERGGQWS